MIGIDIIDIERLKKQKKSFFNKVFTDKELKETNENNFYAKLAGKWAAKEALYKAGLRLANKEIEILSIENKPVLFVDNKKQNCFISISHEKDYAVAVAFLNKTSE